MQQSPEPKSQKIVIIEGADTFGQQTADLLKADGYEHVSLYKSGSEGLKGIYDVLPHLILLDVALPDTTGYKVISQKQAEPLLASIPLFLVSTDGNPVDMHELPPNSIAGMIISFHTKPEEILRGINNFFGYKVEEDEPEERVSAEKKKKVLWIEDDRLLGSILSKKLISSGFDLDYVKSGEEALMSLQKSKPDVIVVDLLLPVMSGFEILQKMKEDSALQDVPKVVLSNLSKASDISKAKSLGALKFLVKASTSLDQVVSEIGSVCR